MLGYSRHRQCSACSSYGNTLCTLVHITASCIHGVSACACHARGACLCRPLINVCDRFDMVEDLTHYLYTNNMLRYIEGYVQKVSPSKAPQVVGSLLDCEAPEDFVTNLILSVRSLIPVEGLCTEVRHPVHGTGVQHGCPCCLASAWLLRVQAGSCCICS